MRPALVILLLVATTALFRSHAWGWAIPAALVAILSLLTLSSALVITAGLLSTWRPLQRRPQLHPLMVNGVAALTALAIWFNYLLGQLAESTASPVQRGLLALALGWMLSPFAGLALTRLGERLGRR